MQLLNPWGALLFALSGLVLLLHMLRPRYQSAPVPSLLLWQQVHEALALQNRWRHLIATLLLIVHLLIVGLLVLSFMQPLWISHGTPPLAVMIVDASASMMATDEHVSRFAQAVSMARQAVIEAQGELVIIVAQSSPYVAYRGTDRLQAASTLARLAPSATSTNWQHVADLVRAFDRDALHVTVWTDGVVDPTDFAHVQRVAGDALRIRLVGDAQANNVAIVAFEARPTGTDLNAYEIMLSVRNYGTVSQTVPIRITANGMHLLEQTTALAPNADTRIITTRSLSGSDVLTADILVTDVLALDNQAFIAISPPQTTRVAWVGPSNRYIEDGLRIFPQVQLERRLLVPNPTEYQLTIYDRVPHAGPGARLAIAPPQPHAPAPGEVMVTWWDPTHPLTRHIDWGSVRINRATPVAIGASTQVLVDSSLGPLLTIDQDAQGQLIQLGFALDDSDLPMRVGFPIFLSQLLQFVHPAGWNQVQPHAVPGNPYRLPAAMAQRYGPGQWQVLDPQGNPLPVVADSEAHWVTPVQSGLHHIVTPDADFPFVVALPPRLESAMQRQVTATEDPHVALTGSGTTSHPLWRYLGIAALALLFFESWLFQHRTRRPQLRARPQAPRPAGNGAQGRVRP